MARIVLYYHAGSKNHGCEAIVKATASILREKLELWSFSPEEDRQYSLAECVDIHDDASLPFKRSSIRYWIAAAGKKILHTDYGFFRYGHAPFFEHFHKNDIALSIGGDNYCYPGRDILGYYNHILRRRGVKTVLWGCSFEPRDLTSDIAKDLSRYSAIVARERISYDLLKRLNPHTVLLPDPAFQLATSNVILPSGFVQGNTVGLNVSPLIAKLESVPGMTMLNYEKLIEHILATTEMSIALIPHVVKSNNDDRDPLKALYNKYRTCGRIVLISDCTASELKGYISQCRFMVTARTHASIAAYSSCVPTLVIGYSVKARGIAQELFDTDEHYILPVQNLHTIDDLTEAFQWLMNHEATIRQHLQSKMPEYQQKTTKLVEVIQKIEASSEKVIYESDKY